MAKAEHPWRSIPSVLDLAETWTPGMRSAARPFRVLEFFDEVRRAARAQEISERLAIPQSTISVLLKAMVEIGYLDYDPVTRSYQTSLRVTLLGSWRDSGRLRAGALMTMLESLANLTGLVPSLSTRAGIYVRYLQTIQQETPGLPKVKLAARRYAVWSVGGIVLLAGLPDREIARLLRRTMAEDDPRARAIDAERVRDMIALTRQQGWLCEMGLVTPNARVIAAAVPAEATGYGEPLALMLSNGTPELPQPAAEVAGIMLDAIRGLAR